MEIMNKKLGLNLFKTVGLISLLVVLQGCSSYHYPNRPFSLMDEGHPVKVTSIAVVAGSNNDATKQLAEFVTAEMQEKTEFKVLSQAQVRKQVHGYPVDIAIKDKETREKEGDDVNHVWFPSSETAKLNAIQKKLKVDNLYVVWIPWMRAFSDGRKTIYKVWPAGNLIEYPGGKVVAATKIYRKESDSILALVRDKGYYIEKAIEKSAKDMVDALVESTNKDK